MGGRAGCLQALQPNRAIARLAQGHRNDRLRTSDGIELLSQRGADIACHPGFLDADEADCACEGLFRQLQSNRPEDSRVRWFGEWHQVPRRQVGYGYGDDGTSYSFTGCTVQARPWAESPALVALRAPTEPDRAAHRVARAEEHAPPHRPLPAPCGAMTMETIMSLPHPLTPHRMRTAYMAAIAAALLSPGAPAGAEPCPLDPPCVDAQMSVYCSVGGGYLSACGVRGVMLVAGHSYWIDGKGCWATDETKLTVTGPRGEIVYERAGRTLDGCLTARASGAHLITMRQTSPTGACLPELLKDQDAPQAGASAGLRRQPIRRSGRP